MGDKNLRLINFAKPVNITSAKNDNGFNACHFGNISTTKITLLITEKMVSRIPFKVSNSIHQSFYLLQY